MCDLPFGAGAIHETSLRDSMPGTDSIGDYPGYHFVEKISQLDRCKWVKGKVNDREERFILKDRQKGLDRNL